MTSPPQQPGQGDPDNEPDESATRADGSPAADQSSAEQSGSTGTSEQPPAEDAGAQDVQAAGEGTQPADGAASDETTGQDDTGQDGTTAEGAKPKKKTGLIVGIIAAVVVLAGAGVAGFVLMGTASAQSVAEDFAEVRTRDMNTLGQQVKPADYEPLVCGKIADQMRKTYDPAKVKQQVDQLPPQMQDAFKSARMKVANVTETGDKAKATFEISAKGQKTEKTDFSLTKEEGQWKMCG